jgi:hypothetical protein
MRKRQDEASLFRSSRNRPKILAYGDVDGLKTADDSLQTLQLPQVSLW